MKPLLQIMKFFLNRQSVMPTQQAVSELGNIQPDTNRLGTRQPIYRPLGDNSFRLLEIQAGTWKDQIVVQLINATLEATPPYDALSYVWGDEKSTVAITCDQAPFNITENLHWSLTRIRYSDRPRIIWVDAICINQDDLKERSHQVSMMGRIFSGARYVFACIGDAPANTTDDILSLCRQLGDTIRDGEALTLHSRDPLWEDARFTSLGEITSRPWFSRAWILQEAGLAKDPRILFGAAEISYRKLIKLIRALPLQLAANFRIRAWLVHMEWTVWSDVWWQYSSSEVYTFLDLLGHASFLTCKDPRDRIYAFLGHPLSQAYNGLPLVTPDYEKDTNLVYLETTARLMQFEGLRVLTKVNNTDESLSEDLPSWVVRWGDCRITNRIYHSLSSPFKASGGINQRSPDLVNGTILKLTGVEIDKVIRSYRVLQSAGGQYIRYQDSNTNKITNIQRVQDFLNDSQTPCAYNYNRRDALRAALSCNPSEESYSVEDFALQKALFCSNRAFFVTARGFYGLGPDITRPGDLCSILFGADVPMVLRSQGLHFKLLGEAYIRDLMHGQVSGMLLREEVLERQFEII